MKSPLLLMSCLVFSILIIGCGSEQKENHLTEQKENHLTERNIKGDVKSVIEKEYDAIERFGEIEKESINSWYDIAFNEEGNQVEWISYDSDGSIDSKWTSEYDEEGNQVEKITYDSDGSLTLKYTYEYDEYDKEDNWTSKITFEDGVATKITEREFEYYD